MLVAVPWSVSWCVSSPFFVSGEGIASPIQQSLSAADAAFEGQPRRGRHPRAECAQFLVQGLQVRFECGLQRLQKLHSGRGANRIFRESEAQHDFLLAPDQVFTSNRVRDPALEFGQTFRRDAENLAAAHAGALLDGAAY